MNAQTTSARDEEHGTAVASVAAAPVNGLGLVGVYPQAALQIWDASPTGDGLSIGDVIQGLDAAIRRGPGVVNLSLGSQIRNPGARRDGRSHCRLRNARRGRLGQQPSARKPARVSGEPAPCPHRWRARPRQCAGVLLERLAARRPFRAWREHPRSDSADLPSAELLRPLLQRHELRLAARRGCSSLGLDGAADARTDAALRGDAAPRRRTSRRRATTPFPASAGSTSPARSPLRRPHETRRSRTRTSPT